MTQMKPAALPPHVKSFYPPQPPQQQPSQSQSQHWRPRGGETVYKTAVFLGSMIVVAMLLLVLICMARWESIIRLVPVFNSSNSRGWLRRRSRRNTGSRAQLRRQTSSQQQQDVEASSEDQYSLSSSLSKKNRSSNRRAVEALPILDYSSNPEAPLGLVGTECTICLSDFSDGDRVRILPDCYHGFHVECVDVWLIAHASCPSCRSSLHSGFASKYQQDVEPEPEEQLPGPSLSASPSSSFQSALG